MPKINPNIFSGFKGYYSILVGDILKVAVQSAKDVKNGADLQETVKNR